MLVIELSVEQDYSLQDSIGAVKAANCLSENGDENASTRCSAVKALVSNNDCLGKDILSLRHTP